MKTFTHLMDEITDIENLWDAWCAVRKRKRRTPEGAAFEVHLERNIDAIQQALRTGRYMFGRYRLFFIADPKRRLIAAAPLRDRIVHHAIVQRLHATYGQSFIHDSYACLVNKGTHRAIIRFLSRLRTYDYVLKLDIVRYFPSVSWDILLKLLVEKTPDQQFLRLMSELLESGRGIYTDARTKAYLGPDFSVPDRHGIPIGNYTSQWFGNFYLNGLDHFIKRNLKIKGYQRYMDDITLFADSKNVLREAQEAIEVWLCRERGLFLHSERAHPNPSHIAHRYLGYTITPAGIFIGPRLIKRLRSRLPLLFPHHFAKLPRTLASYRGVALF